MSKEDDQRMSEIEADYQASMSRLEIGKPKKRDYRVIKRSKERCK